MKDYVTVTIGWRLHNNAHSTTQRFGGKDVDFDTLGTAIAACLQDAPRALSVLSHAVTSGLFEFEDYDGVPFSEGIVKAKRALEQAASAYLDAWRCWDAKLDSLVKE